MKVKQLREESQLTYREREKKNVRGDGKYGFRFPES
jgi:hypothetical protein